MIIVSIKSAEMARQETEPNKIHRELEEIQKKQEQKEKEEQQVVDIIEYLKQQIDNKIKQGYNSLYYRITEQDYIYKHLDNFHKQIQQVLKAFTEAGYATYIDYFSDSWQYRSGNICIIQICWESEQ